MRLTAGSISSSSAWSFSDSDEYSGSLLASPAFIFARTGIFDGEVPFGFFTFTSRPLRVRYDKGGLLASSPFPGDVIVAQITMKILILLILK